jgi:integrase/recombinase XerD
MLVTKSNAGNQYSSGVILSCGNWQLLSKSTENCFLVHKLGVSIMESLSSNGIIAPQYFRKASVEDSLNLFFRHLVLEKGRSKNTLIAYKIDLGQFLAVLQEQLEGTLLPEDLSQELLSTFQQWLNAKRYKPSTINRKWAAIRAYLEFLQLEGYISSTNLMDTVDMQSVERSIPVVLSREEVERLLAAPTAKDNPLARRDSAILALMYNVGLRATDVVSLTLGELDIERGLVRSPWSATGLITITNCIDPVRTYLFHGRPHLARDPDEQALFLNQRGTGLSRQGLWLIVKRWVDAANIEAKVTPHTLRHSLAKHLLDSGWSLKEVQQKLGLKSPNSIRIFNLPKDFTDEAL